MTQVLIGGPGNMPRVDQASGRVAIGVLESLLARREAMAILVSDAAGPFLARRVVLLPVDRGEWGYGLSSRGSRTLRLRTRGPAPSVRLVGRAHEMDAISTLAARVAQGRGRLLGVVGEPGVGKSRFAFEASRWRAYRAGGSWGAPRPRTGPPRPICRFVSSFGPTSSWTTPSRASRASRARRGQGSHPGAGARGRSPRVARAASWSCRWSGAGWAGLDPARQRRQHCLEAIKRLWLRESQLQPLLLILEDLHWSDSETQAVLDTLEESLPAARLLFLVTYRPGFRHGWADRTYYTQLRLDPLTPEGTAELLRHLLGSDRSLGPVAELVTARCEGNVFFLEETVRMLAETGVIAGEPGARGLAGPVHAIKVPETVQALLAARMDRLSPRTSRCCRRRRWSDATCRSCS